MGNCNNQFIGLMGGSFNPAHSGHKMISELAIKRLRLNRLWWLVSPQNPLKGASDMAPLDDRVNTAQQIANNPKIEVTKIETYLGTQYTVDLLLILKRRFPRTKFVWVMGADNLAQLSKWKDWEKIIANVRIAIFDRPSFSLQALSGKIARRFIRYRLYERQSLCLMHTQPPAWIFYHTNLNNISATRLRSNRKNFP